MSRENPTPAPLSHLLLERYALGELDDGEAARVAEQLLHSEQDRLVYEAILADQTPLPALLLPVGEVALPSAARPQRGRSATDRAIGAESKRAGQGGRRGRASLFWTGAVTAAAAAAALLLSTEPLSPRIPKNAEDRGRERVRSEGVKGTEVILSLVGERSGPGPNYRLPGESLKLRVTCADGSLHGGRVSVFQGERVYHPLPSRDVFLCGNLRAWPGAFRLEGDEPATLCLSWGQDALRGPEREGEETACIVIPPVRGPQPQ